MNSRTDFREWASWHTHDRVVLDDRIAIRVEKWVNRQTPETIDALKAYHLRVVRGHHRDEKTNAKTAAHWLYPDLPVPQAYSRMLAMVRMAHESYERS